MNSIKDLALAAGAQDQYEQDYSHLSGIEHTDVTATIVQQLVGPRYGDFIAIKSSYVFMAVLDMALRIHRIAGAADYAPLVAEFNALTDEVTRSERERGA